MGTFTVAATLIHPLQPERRRTLDLVVDPGATWTLLPSDVVAEFGLRIGRQRTVMLASGEQVVYPMGQVVMRLGTEELTTIFLAGPPGCQALLGAVTLEELGVAPDPIRKVLIPIVGLLA